MLLVNGAQYWKISSPPRRYQAMEYQGVRYTQYYEIALVLLLGVQRELQRLWLCCHSPRQEVRETSAKVLHPVCQPSHTWIWSHHVCHLAASVHLASFPRDGCKVCIPGWTLVWFLAAQHLPSNWSASLEGLLYVWGYHFLGPASILYIIVTRYL